MSAKTSRARIAAATAVLALAAVGAAQGAGKLISVDWANPELVAFASAQAANPPRSLGPTADDKLAKLKLPVLGFAGTPGVVESTFRLGAKPATERDVIVDETNPVWYQIVERYGDVTVSIEADLRVQHEFPASYPVYKNAGRGAAPEAGPVVSVFDEQNENGIEGLIAEYTIMKYGVLYTVTIECSAEAKAQCHDTSQIAKDSELLTLIRANAPAK
ncbi:MAG: hypothetical protein WC807_14120 [Hyphomicrobium sp.]|jgi:hypothetical protein